MWLVLLGVLLCIWQTIKCPAAGLLVGSPLR